MGGFKLLSLAAIIFISATDSWRILKSSNVGKGVEYIVSDDDTGTLGIPLFWLSNADVKADKKKAAAYCKTMGIEWELGFINGTHFHDAISTTIQTAEKLLAGPATRIQSDYFWVAAEFDEHNTYMFVWTKTNDTVKESGEEFFTGEIDDERKFQRGYDSSANQTYGLLAYVSKYSAYLRYTAAKTTGKHRYMCTKTKAIPVKPTTPRAPQEPSWDSPGVVHK